MSPSACALASLLAGASSALRVDPRYPWGELPACAAGPHMLVASIGGCGDSAFTYQMGMIRPALCPNHPTDKDDLKHRPYNRMTEAAHQTVKKIVYLYANITTSVLSINRRNWLNGHARKMRTRPYKKSLHLDWYADMEGDEFLQVEDHVMGYLTQCEIPVAFVDVTKRDEHLDELAAFLEVPVQELLDNVTPWITSSKAEERAEDQVQAESPPGAPEEASEPQHLQEEEKFLDRVKEYLIAEKGDLTAESDDKLDKGEKIGKARRPGRTPPQRVRHSYEDVPRQIIERLEKKFESVNRRLRELGPFHVHRPEDCR